MLYRYNPAAPVLLEATVNIGGNPYSLASGGDYIIASNMGSGGTKRVNITTLAVDSAPCPATYGVVADPAGGVAYLGGWDGSGNVYKADFNANTCTGWATASTYVTAMTLDLGGNIWASGYTNQTLQKFNPAGVLLGSYPMPGANPHGLSVAFDSMIWSVSDGQQCLSQVDPNSGAVLQSVEIGGPGVPARTPYLYSDFTGVQINRQAPYTYVGSWNAVYDSMIPNVPWSKVVWNTEPQGAVPAETSLSVSVRAANSMASLGTASYSVATNATAFPNVSGEFVQVRVDFNGPGFVTPVLSDIAVLGLCLPLSNTCCVQDSNCTTNNLCSVGTCPNPGGACVFTPKPNCCMVDADCNDQNLCTADTCPVPGGQCAHAPVPLCCNSNADCSDLNPCHLDICSGPGGQCSYPPIMGCCNKNSDCTQGNPCSSATCPVPGGFCVGSSVGGCCKMDSDCNDNNACTADTCNVAAMTCSHSAIAGCCNTDADCNSNNVCITDHCSGPGGTCGHTSVPSCCVPNDPNDPMIGMPCDAPVSPNDHPPCKAGGWACTNGVYTCVGAVTPSIPICNGMDNDCSGVVDTTCPMGQACISGQCDIACSGSEFNCPNGGRCINGYCIPPSCTGVVCPAGLTCVQGVCGVDGGAAGPDSGGGPGGGQDGGSSSGDAGSMQGGGMDGGAGVDGSGGGGGPVPTAPYGGTKSKGCGCTVPGATGTPATSGLLLVGLAFAAARARRRRSR
jgi:MYXO-CTERM domain-containing protein